MTEARDNKMKIQDVSPEAVKGMVEFMYTGNTPSNIGDMVEDLLHLAEVYKVGSLKRACERRLLDDLAVENAVNTFILVDR